MSNYQQSMITQLYSQFSPAEGETVRQITVDELIDIAEFGDIYQLFYHPPGGLDITPSGNPKLYLHMRNFNEDTNRSEIVDLTNSLTLELGIMDDGSGTINENSNHNAIKITLYDPVSNTIVNENVIFLSILREPRFTFFISTRENGEYQVKPIKPARTNNNSRRNSRSQIQRQH